MFVDEVTIEIYAGDGGGPFGGDGGKGGDIIFKVDSGVHTLLDLRYQKILRADKGSNGEGKNKDGANAQDLIIKVPLGTIVTDLDNNEVIADLTKNKEEKIIAHGGRGGRGNTSLKTQTNTAPNYSENGAKGEYKKIKVELKLMADVGLVGLPSVGKSTIISVLSASRPKIAAYHFTTLHPNLGVVKASNGNTFVMADLPGLIEGASLGAGLGDKFLKHVERTKIIAHVIDMGGVEERNPVEDYKMINKELEDFNKKLLKKPQIIIANKMDLPNAKDNLEKFKKEIKDIKIFEVSALTNKGLQKVVDYLEEELSNMPEEEKLIQEKAPTHKEYTFVKEEPFTITKEDDVWVLSGKEIEKVFEMTKFETEEGIYRFANKLSRMGVDDKLRELGAKEGDKVRIKDFYFDYTD